MNGNVELNIEDYKKTLNLPHTDFLMRGDGPRREPEIQKFWFQNDIYKKILEKRKNENKASFLLHDGPPYLSSPNIHIGTALNKILKDIVVKYKTQKGFYSPYLPGFDCHGLPIESAVIKASSQELSASSQINELLTLRKKCKEFVLRNRVSQEEKFKRLGVLGDWGNSYMTINPVFEASQLELFGLMVEKGYIYRGLKPVFWCSECETALAEAEVEYVEHHKSPSIYVAFPVTKLPGSAVKFNKFKNLRIAIWTTTPWTIPGNLAICLNENFTYVVAESKKYGFLLIAKDLLDSFCKKISETCLIKDEIKGNELENTFYKHPLYEKECPVILGPHVTLETGTGCVHTAPGHGLEDFEIGQKYSLSVFSPVDNKGIFTENASGELKGLYVHKAGNQKIIELLDKKSLLILKEDYQHSYPHCWRSKTPIIFRATEQWFCSVNKFRKQSLAEIDNVKWIPEIGRNRIYTMVESRTDWCISRQRVWGVPIPAFYCNGCDKVHLNKKIIDHVSRYVEQYGTDIWWEKDSSVLLPKNYKCDCGGSDFRKEKDTMDVWFDSGSTHYSVINRVDELKNIKNIMYLEGSDQHRGWFQSSLLTSVAVSGKAPYTEVVTHGFVLDEQGRKMSKSLGNVIEPEEVISQYGADILRLWVSSVDYSQDIKIGLNMLKQLAEVYRNIRNTTRFILGNLYDFNPGTDYVSYEKLWNIDKYALHTLEEVKEEVSRDFENYELYRYYQIVQNYCAVDLSSFYFDLNKDRLYTSGKNSLSRRSVQTVLYEILNLLLSILSPVLPHLSEDIWRFRPQNFTTNYESVLFLDWPVSNEKFKNDVLDIEFASILLIKNVVYKALELARQDKKIGKSLEAKVLLYPKNDRNYDVLRKFETELPTIFIVSQIMINNVKTKTDKSKNILAECEDDNCYVQVLKADGEKCPRCWKWATDIGASKKHPKICKACAEAVLPRPLEF